MDLGLSLRLGTANALLPAMALDFVSSTSLDSRITFTRGSTATFVGSNGLIQSAAINAPRFDYDPVTLAPRGLLIEEARTNLLLRSEEYSNASWNKVDTTVSANALVAPDGTTTADLLTEGTAGTATMSQSGVITPGAAFTASAFLKRGSTDWVRLRVVNGSDSFQTWINLATGALGSGTATNAGTFLASTVTAFGNGWYRVTVTGTLPASPAGAFLNTSAANGSATRVSNGTYNAWGSQLEAGAFATSYIPTVSSTVTRSADVASMTGTNFSSWYNQSEGTFVADFGALSGTTARILTVSNGTVNNQTWMQTGVGTQAMLQVYTAGAFVAQIVPTGATAGPAKLAGAIKTNDFAASVNGGAVGTDTSGAIGTYDRMGIGTNFNGSVGFLNGHIRSIAYYNRRLPNAQLQAITA